MTERDLTERLLSWIRERKAVHEAYRDGVPFGTSHHVRFAFQAIELEIVEGYIEKLIEEEEYDHD